MFYLLVITTYKATSYEINVKRRLLLVLFIILLLFFPSLLYSRGYNTKD